MYTTGMTQRLKQFFSHREHFILLLIIVFAVLTNIIWIWLDQSPPLWDIAGHSQRSAYFAELIAHGNIKTLLQFDTIYPPFPYIVTGILFILFGFHSDIPQYSLLLYVIVFLISTYSLSVTLFKQKWVACIATTLTLCYPLLLHFSRIYDLDFPLTVLVTASIATLFKTDHFQKRNWSILCALSIAAALLTKWTAIIFLITPITLYCIQSYRTLSTAKRKIARMHILLILISIGILASPWYLIHAKAILHSAAATRKNIFSVPYEQLFNIQNITYYARKTMQAITWPMSIVFIAGCIRLLILKNKTLWLLLSWIAVPYLIMTFVFYSKESRYVLPLFPLLAILSASLFVQLKRKYVVPLMSIILCIGVFFWMELSWGMPFLPPSVYQPLHINTQYGYQPVTTQKVYYGFTYPTQYHTNLSEMVAVLQHDIQNHSTDKDVIHVAVIPNSIFLTAQQIQYYTRLQKIDSITQPYVIDYSLSSQVRGGDDSEWKNVLPTADYVITKTGDQGPEVWSGQLPLIAEEEQQLDSAVFAEFEIIGEWTLSGIEAQPQRLRLYRHR